MIAPFYRFVPLALAAALAPPTAAERPPVVVTDPQAQTFRIAVQRFAAPGDAVDAEAFRDALIADLEFSSVFRSIDAGAFLGPFESAGLDAAGAPSCSDWSTIGADALLEGEIRAVTPGDRVQVEFRAVDIVRCRPLLRRRYDGAERDLRPIARSLADAVVEAFTGIAGVASTEITFIAERGAYPEVYVVNADGSDARPVSRERAKKGFPNWSPDGNSIVYMSYLIRRVPHLHRLVRGGTQQPGRLLRQLHIETSVYRGVHAPDGSAMAVVVNQNGSPDIFRTPTDGRGPMSQLTRSPAIDIAPTWSPDGDRIAFVSDRSGSPQIYVMESDGSDVRRLTFQGGYNTGPAWSPDGRWIAYESRRDGQFDIWRVDPEGQKAAPLVSHPRNDEFPTWSPDGRKLAFHSDRRGVADIYIIDLNGKNSRRLTGGTGENKQPHWGPYRH